jgi:glutathionylspermidine synthase
MALHGFKWDAQVGDLCTLAPFAVILPHRVWEELASLAEALAGELIAAENELKLRPELWRALGLPRAVTAALGTPGLWTPSAARVVRFDFHPTAEGWKISEVNSDVPGGYTEASRFTQLMAEAVGAGIPTGDPTAKLCAALRCAAARYGRIGFLSAAGYLEDQQVISSLAARLRADGVETVVTQPEQISWHDGIAHCGHDCSARPLDALFRFYQGEWMTRLPHNRWTPFFRGGATPVCNPPAAVLSESKRLPLVWDSLATSMPTWRRLLPDTRSFGAMLARPRRSWVLKAAYSNTGDAVYGRSWSRPLDYAFACGHAAVRPNRWLAQEEFRAAKLMTPAGPAHVCLGVYVIDGHCCGTYGRTSLGDMIDYRAVDTAILVENQS